MTVQPYSIQRARQMNYILTAAQPAMNYAYDKLVDIYRVQSLHDLTDEQLDELVADVQAWELERSFRG